MTASKNEDIPSSYLKIPVMVEYAGGTVLDRKLLHLTRVPCVGEEVWDDEGCLIVRHVTHFDLNITDWLCQREYVAKILMGERQEASDCPPLTAKDTSDLPFDR